MHQFAYGPTGENPDYGHMHNPWNPDLVSGGSSGGSGSATAAGQCTITTGSDTGGSIRIPAALCGIVGLKPTYGRVSRHGLTPLAWSMDHPGPMVRTVEDAAITMNVIAGHDPRDVASADLPVPDYTAALTGPLVNKNGRGLRIGVPRQHFEAPLDPEVRGSVNAALSQLESLGAELVEVDFPEFNSNAAISTTMLMAEASAALRDVLTSDGDKLYEPVRLRLEAGLFISAADYLRAQQGRAVFDRAARRLLDDVDLLAGPTEPVTAPPLLQQQVLAGRAGNRHRTRPHSVHPALQHHRLPRHIHPLRLLSRRSPHRPAARRPPLRRRDRPTRRPRLRTVHRLAHPPPAAVTRLVSSADPGGNPGRL